MSQIHANLGSALQLYWSVSNPRTPRSSCVTTPCFTVLCFTSVPPSPRTCSYPPIDNATTKWLHCHALEVRGSCLRRLKPPTLFKPLQWNLQLCPNRGLGAKGNYEHGQTVLGPLGRSTFLSELRSQCLCILTVSRASRKWKLDHAVSFQIDFDAR